MAANEVQSLPIELQLQILSSTDGCGLVNCGRTCRLWHNLFLHLEASVNIWLQLCLREIPVSMLVDITGLQALSPKTDCYSFHSKTQSKKSCKSPSKLPPQYWKEAYKQYATAINITKRKSCYKKLFFPSEMREVTTLRFRDSLLVTGHENGSLICWWDLNTVIPKHRCLERHLARVNSVDIACIGNAKDICRRKLVAVSGSTDRNILVQSLDQSIPSSRTIKHYSGIIQEISVFGQYFTVAAESAILNRQFLWHVESVEEATADVSYSFECIDQRCTNIHTSKIWGNKVYTGDGFGLVVEYDLDLVNPNGQVSPHRIEHFSSLPKQMALQGDNLVIMFASGNVYIKPEGKKTLQLVRVAWFKKFGGLPQKLVLRGSVLAIGLHGGRVLLYHLPNARSWESQDFYHPAAQLVTLNSHINCLDVGYNGSGPLVIVSGDAKCLEVFSWSGAVS